MYCRNSALSYRAALTVTFCCCLSARGGAGLAVAPRPPGALIAAQCEKDTGQQGRLPSGSSGNFFRQMQNGAPVDVFLSADID